MTTQRRSRFKQVVFAGYQMVYALRRELFGHLQRLSLSLHHRARCGELLTKVTG
jgi:ABC-type multidrug transport system fused ATPase/permease subunit